MCLQMTAIALSMAIHGYALIASASTGMTNAQELTGSGYIREYDKGDHT